MTHMKRMIAPPYWKTGKKTAYWVIAPRPGRHAKSACIPLLVIVRDVLKLAGTAREAKAILSAGNVLVDGKMCSEAAFAVGLMDTISLQGIAKHYRALPATRGGLRLVEIPEAEAATKVLKVTGKRTLKGKKTQITFHDGRTLLLAPSDGGEKGVKTGYSAVFNLKDGKVLKFLPLERRSLVLVYKGAHSGKLFEVSSLKPGLPTAPPTVVLEAGRKSLETLREYVIAVGIGSKPEITIPASATEVA
jgi:small subunit ribosomal protein S4e